MGNLYLRTPMLTGNVSQLIDPNAISFGAPAIMYTASQWFDADDIGGADGTAVSTWASRVGSSSFVQASGSLQPLLKTSTNGISGHNVVRTDGASVNGDYMICPWNPSFAAFTIALLIRPNISETTHGIFQWCANGSLTDNTPMVLFQRSTDGTLGDVVRVYIGPAGYRWTIAHASGAAKLYFLKWTGTVWSLEVNGVDQGLQYTAGTSGNHTGLMIGSGYNGYSNSDIAVASIWLSGLSATDQASATSYLKNKGGL